MSEDEKDRVAIAGAREIPVRHRKIGPLSRRFFQVYAGLIEKVLEPYELDGGVYGVLVELDDKPGIDQRRLGEALGIDRTTTGEIVDELERRGLIDRRIDPDDRRARVLSLSKKGDALRRKVRPHMLAAQERFVAPLSTEERAMFLDMLYRLVAGNLDHEVAGGFRRRKRKS